MAAEIIFKMKDISKNFPGVKALDGVSFEVKKGEVHALVGENGAGKSTLIKILSGLYQADSGQVIYQGNPLEMTDPRKMQGLGISVIYQELNLCPNLSVAENICLGREPVDNFRFLDKKKAYRLALKYLGMLGVDIDPDTQISRLRVAEQQLVEIAKAFSVESQVIIMDEPTASISMVEANRLLEIVIKAKQQGRAVIYISHRLEEVFKIADTVTVIKDGRHVGTSEVDELDYDQIIRMMVGREIKTKHLRHTQTAAVKKPQSKELLRVEGLSDGQRFQDITFSLYAGEILGFSGLVGAGRTELMETIFGLIKAKSGSIKIEGRPVKIRSSRDAIRNGLGLVTEDRKNKSLFLNFNIRENVTISCLKKFLAYCQVIKRSERRYVSGFINEIDIKPSNQEAKVLYMSGGNQQKVVIAKGLATHPDILIIDEPTRGVDVGAKSEIHKIMGQLAAQGKAIICVSSELPEILSLCDRILVMNKGRLVGEFINHEASEEKIMALSV